MTTMDLFNQEQPPPPNLTLLIERGNIKPIIEYLSKCSQESLIEQSLKAGLSLIGFHHGKPSVISHLITQILKKSGKKLRTIIAGGRDYQFTPTDIAFLDSIADCISEVVSGACNGADAAGEAWAESKGIPVKRYPADWKTHGKAAGPIRNIKMAQYAGAVVLFPGGRGTTDMNRTANRYNLVVHKRFE